MDLIFLGLNTKSFWLLATLTFKVSGEPNFGDLWTQGPKHGWGAESLPRCIEQVGSEPLKYRVNIRNVFGQSSI